MIMQVSVQSPKLPFLSKVIEKVVHAQLSHHLLEHSLLDHFQSAFRPNHRTESAHIHVLNDILTETDAGSFVRLLLLDLSAAFDTVDHNILLTRLESFAGVTGTALNWFHSYLSDRSFSIHIGDCSSPFVPLPWGVPQGSILGPLLFSIYILPLGNIIAKRGLHYHIYADDCQIYMALNRSSSITQLSECLAEIKTWLASNIPKFNDNKTEAILFKPKHNLHTSAAFDFSPLNLNSCVTSLGVKLDADLSVSAHVNATVRSCFFQLSCLTRLKPILKRPHLESVIHAFITSRLDFSNSVLIGANVSVLNRLQKVQKAAARFLSNTNRRCHITPIPVDLHWIPVHFRIQYKVLTFAYKALNGLAPLYLSELLTPYIPSRSLRSADHLLLKVPKMKYKARGERAFAFAAPRLWNALPLVVRQASSLAQFKSSLKPHFFNLAFGQ
uniref:Reverse transcriptase domain-containing protein n=1 Tax=Nothobranchius furzeri TaxID=105023 RepID=A0A8C6LTZ9_NOTFU